MNFKYLTLKECIKKFPEVTTKFNWSEREIGIFYKCHLLLGYYHKSTRCVMIREDTFVQLIEYVNKQLLNKTIHI